MDAKFAKELVTRGFAKSAQTHFADNTVEIQVPLVRHFFPETPMIAIHSPASEEAVELSGFPDSSWGDDMATRRSTTGYVFLLNGVAVDWRSRMQPTHALSTTEAEYMAIFHADVFTKALSKASFNRCVVAMM